MVDRNMDIKMAKNNTGRPGVEGYKNEFGTINRTFGIAISRYRDISDIETLPFDTICNKHYRNVGGYRGSSSRHVGAFEGR